MSMIRITSGRRVAEADGFLVSCAIEAVDLPAELWFRVRSTAGYQEPPDDLNWALVALLLPAMRAGRDIRVDGPISARLLFNVKHDVQAALRLYDPDLQRIAITAAEVSTPAGAGKQRVGTGFSAGIDSFAVVALAMPQPDRLGLHLTDLCVFNVGAFGPCDAAPVKDRFAQGYARAAAFAHRIGAVATGIDSNVDQFFDQYWSFQRSHSLRNVAAALVMARYFDYYLYASTFPLGSVRVTEHYDLAIMDPILLPLLSTEQLEFRSAGAGLSRFEKTGLVSITELSYNKLDVCVAPVEAKKMLDRPNCSRCWKCQRTMLTLDLLGAIEKYDRVFDVPHYYASRQAIVQAVAGKALRGSEVDREVIDKYLELRLTGHQRALFRATTLGRWWLQTIRATVRAAKKRLKSSTRL